MTARLCCVLTSLLLVLTAAVADEPRPDGHAPTIGGFFEFPSTEFLQEQQQARLTEDAIFRQFQVLRIHPKFDQQPLDEVVQQLAKLTKTSFQIDAAALAEEGVWVNTRISFATRKPQRVIDVLERILEPLQIGWLPEGNMVRVTTLAARKDLVRTKGYRVRQLLQFAAERDVRLPESARLVSGQILRSADRSAAIRMMLEQGVREATSGPWAGQGEGGPDPRIVLDQMLVRQTFEVHREVHALLRTVELVLARPFGSPPLLATETDDEAANSDRLQRVLKTELDVDFADKPLADVVQWLSDKLNDEIILEWEALAEEGIPQNGPVTFRGLDSARSILQQVLEPKGLTFEIRQGAILVTTISTSRARLQTVVYDVADFLQAGHSIQNVVQLLEDSTSGPWRNTGEGGTLTEFPGGLLVVRQVATVHSEITWLLSDLRKTMHAEAQSSRREKAELQTRFHRARSKAEAEALQRLLPNLVAPSTWNTARGRGQIGTADDRLIIRQTNAVHGQIDRFLNEYQRAKPIGSTTK